MNKTMLNPSVYEKKTDLC